MSDQTFVLGQRWISNTEPELGLGIITAFENRQITISFPAAAEARTYASNNAPINRVRYEVGDEVKNTDELLIRITEVREQHNYLVYIGTDADGTTCAIPELEIDSFVHFRRPQDRLFSGQVDKPNDYQLRVHTLQQKEQQRNKLSRGLLGARVQLLPHQLHIAAEVAQRFAPRVLLADEVGLGKTIEAGLIAHHQIQCGRAQRVLVVVPEALIHQWLVEMLRRFNMSFTILDEDRCDALKGEGNGEGESEGDEENLEPNEQQDNPFETSQLILCSLSFLVDNPVRVQQASNCDWDLMIVDEAHHLEWQPDLDSQPGPNSQPTADSQPTAASLAYRCVETLAQRSLGLLLLTATPEQLGVESHFARLRLLDPNRYFDLEKFLQEEQSYQPANDLLQQLLSDNISEEINQPTLQKELKQLLGAERAGNLTQQLQDDNADHAAAIDNSIRFLLDHHGTGRVLFRNTRKAVSGFPIRQLIPHPLDAPDKFKELASSAPLQQQLQSEQLWGDLRQQSAQAEWLQQDPRITWLTTWLKEHKRDKILFICRSQETVLVLEEYLRLRVGIRSAAFYEGMSLIERDRAAAYFADDIDGAQILLCSEIGSEGRNFQFAHHLVLFDLPINPDLLEQRIGRLARIGQKNDVQIHVPFFANTAQEKLLQWFHQGLNAVEESCPASQALYQQFGSELKQHLCEDTSAEWQSFLLRSQQATQDALLKLAQGRDRLLELNSCNVEHAQQLIDSIATTDQDEALRDYMSKVFEAFNVEDDHHSEGSIVLHPSDHVHEHFLPGLTDDGLTATFRRDIALSREDMEFLTWEHPMVLGSMDMIISNEKGNTAVCSAKLPPLKGGTLLLETVFSLHCPGPKYLQLDRYFDLTTLRLLVSKDHDLSKALPFDKLNQLQQTVPRKTAQEIVKFARNDILELLGKCQKLAEEQREHLVRSAVATMLQRQQHELERLETLANINPNVRQEEIDYLKQLIKELEHHLHLAQVGLDCLRVIVCQ